MKWAWAKPSRPSPPAPCSSVWAARERVLVVTPASLKGEWEEQIRQFTDLPTRLVFGGLAARRSAYDAGTFFTVVNYEQMIRDALEVNARFRPDVVVLDEAQRIKNWNTQDRAGHQAVAEPLRLRSHRHAHREPD